MSRRFSSLLMMGPVMVLSSCSLLNKPESADNSLLGPSNSDLLSTKSEAGAERVMDIRATRPKNYRMDLSRPQVSDGLFAGTPPPILTGTESLGEMAADELPASSSEPKWVPVPTLSLNAPTVPTVAKATRPDAGTVRALVQALPTLTAASIAEPFLLARMTANTPEVDSRPAMSSSLGAAFTATPPAAARPVPSVAAAWGTPVAGGSFARTAESSNRGTAPRIPPAAMPPRLLTSEHEAE